MTFTLLIIGMFPGDIIHSRYTGLQTCLTVARQINEQTSNRAVCAPARK